MSTRLENSEYRKSTGMYDNISENF